VLAGDVGSGKTELAETIGDAVARQEKIEITLLPAEPLKSRPGASRGNDATPVRRPSTTRSQKRAKLKGSTGRSRGAIILLVDEADALAQSRESAQMHHEDRAGRERLHPWHRPTGERPAPAAVIMCTNRLSALDPAVKRRAADVLTFTRPTDDQRRDVLERWLGDVGLKKADIDALVAATGPQAGRAYGFTFSDLAQRLLPTIILDAYPAGPIKAAQAIALARSIEPTPPFNNA
jgi:AAA+ superfamily predicted ATPase